MTQAAADILDELLNNLEAMGQQKKSVPARPSNKGDAIDQVLNSPGRTTATVSLQNAPEVTAFREALTDGLIRADALNGLLRLINEVVVRWMV